MDLGVDDRHYLLTAASRGLGLATAASLARDGAWVTIVARDATALDRAAADLGPRAGIVCADLSQASSAESILQALGGQQLDGVLINVGGPEPGAALNLTDEQWQAAFDQVVMSSLRLIRAVVPALRPGSCILLVLSSTVKEPIATLAASNVLRPGLAMLVKDLSVQLADRGIRVNGILPGRIATDRLLALTGDDPAGMSEVSKGIPLGRLGRPDEFGDVAAFLLSPASSYITGALVPVDGGLLRSPW